MRVTASTFAGIAYNNFGSSGIALEKLVEALSPAAVRSSLKCWRAGVFMHFALCAGYWLLFILLTPPAGIPCYMSQANVTPELMMEQETISAAMEMAKPNWFASSEQAVRAATLSRGLT